MKDIKSTTRSGSGTNRIPLVRSERVHADRVSEQLSRGHREPDHKRNLSSRVEAYERGDSHANRGSGRDDEDDHTDEDIYTYRRRPLSIKSAKKSYKGYIYTLIFLGVLVTAFYLLTYKFNNASVIIKVRSIDVNQNGQLTLSNASTTVYETYEVSETSSMDIKKSSYVDVKAKAKGMVTIYNNNDNHAQKLVKNTRLETSDGKIYRITSSILVPGKVDNVPGSVSVMAIADTYGNEYNISVSKFTIPGFKGNVKYNNFYGKSNDLMTGGDMGKKYIISDQDIKDAEAKLVPDLEAKIREKIKDYKNDSYVIVKDNIIFTRTNNKDVLEKDQSQKTYMQKVKGTFLIIKKFEMAKSIAKANISDYNGVDIIEIADYDALKVYTKNGISTSTYTIGVEYKGNIKWVIDSQSIVKDLAGKGISDFAKTMTMYTGVDSAVPSFMPMWSHTFPIISNKIHIKTE